MCMAMGMGMWTRVFLLFSAVLSEGPTSTGIFGIAQSKYIGKWSDKVKSTLTSMNSKKWYLWIERNCKCCSWSGCCWSCLRRYDLSNGSCQCKINCCCKHCNIYLFYSWNVVNISNMFALKGETKFAWCYLTHLLLVNLYYRSKKLRQ